MPVKIPATLPGREILEKERVPLILEDRALRQDIRPLRIAILNLMPDKISTETQLLRVLGATPLQIEITLLHPASHESKNTAPEHLRAFYATHSDIKNEIFDGLIVTGAPVEHLPYEEVTYWKELTEILDWAPAHAFASFFICWGAQAALWHYHDISKVALPRKQSGIYPHRLTSPWESLTAGFEDVFNVPVSRHTKIHRAEILKIPELAIVAESDMTGVCLVQDIHKRRVYMFNHLEYDADTLNREYVRDVQAGNSPDLPYNYFPGNDPSATPAISWRAHRALLFSNWINMIYQATPFDLKQGFEEIPFV